MNEEEELKSFVGLNVEEGLDNFEGLNSLELENTPECVKLLVGTFP